MRRAKKFRTSPGAQEKLKRLIEPHWAVLAAIYHVKQIQADTIRACVAKDDFPPALLGRLKNGESIPPSQLSQLVEDGLLDNSEAGALARGWHAVEEALKAKQELPDTLRFPVPYDNKGSHRMVARPLPGVHWTGSLSGNNGAPDPGRFIEESPGVFTVLLSSCPDAMSEKKGQYFRVYLTEIPRTVWKYMMR